MRIERGLDYFVCTAKRGLHIAHGKRYLRHQIAGGVGMHGETGGQPLVDGIEGRKSVEIILAIYQSAWTGKAVKLPLAKDPKRPASA